jgi:glycosyltransferase 2 family protein
VKLRIVIIGILGLCLALYLVLYVGAGAVAASAASIGWSGFAVLCLYSLALFPLTGTAWYVLLPEFSRTGARVLIWARMVRDAAADLLPFSQFGGIVIGARAAMFHGVPSASAFASTIVDITTEMLAQIAYIAIGFGILTTHAPRTSFAASVSKFVLVGLGLAVLAGSLLIVLQRCGHRLTARLAARLLPRALGSTAAVTDTLDKIYESRVRVALSSSIHLAAWIASSVTTWIAFRLTGVQVDFALVIALDSLVCAARTAAVLIPNALGVQEATYALLAPLFGIGPPAALAVSFLKRARDIALGVPVLLIWQLTEGHRALTRGASNDCE